MKSIEQIVSDNKRVFVDNWVIKTGGEISIDGKLYQYRTWELPLPFFTIILQWGENASPEFRLVTVRNGDNTIAEFDADDFLDAKKLATAEVRKLFKDCLEIINS